MSNEDVFILVLIPIILNGHFTVRSLIHYLKSPPSYITILNKKNGHKNDFKTNLYFFFMFLTGFVRHWP